jgi:hypothetical protein
MDRFDDDWQEPEYDTNDAEPRDDPKINEASSRILHFFDEQPDEVFYEMQLEVIFEDDYFHWITTKALARLRDGGKIHSSLEILPDVGTIRFYFNRKNRYWRRKAAEVKRLVQMFSRPNFTSALGNQGELLTDAGLSRVGFIEKARNVSEFNGLRWTASKHNLDRVFEKDGVLYGAEIKNRLSYISQNEFQIKSRMCEVLQLRPLFIARMMPKSYIYELFQQRGFALIMKHQFYPLAHEDFAREVRQRLHLPVDCPTRLADGTLQRLLKYHLRSRQARR